jgi:hypothetical protein
MCISTKTSPLHKALALVVLLTACHSSIRYPAGGYDYPSHVADKDSNFYFYPIKNKESRLDSFAHSFYYRFYWEFGEPNLSMHSQPATVLRLTRQSLGGFPVIITLYENEVIIKQGRPGKGFSQHSYTNRLTAIEKMHFKVLQWYFPIEDGEHSLKKKYYLDSLGTVYPQLHDPGYYSNLLQKAFPYKSPIFAYTERRIPISRSVFDTVVTLINNSGFWQQPVHIRSKHEPNDDLGFLLEANTAQKYNVVFADGGGDDSSQFNRACQELVRYAKMDSVIHLVPDKDRISDTVRPPVVVQDVYLEEIKESHLKKHKKK